MLLAISTGHIIEGQKQELGTFLYIPVQEGLGGE